MLFAFTDKNRRFAFCMALFFMVAAGLAQSYFQQEVNYRMQVRLNDEKHSLHARTEMQYINNSPETLKEIWFHLWPNAYKDNSTALAKQLLTEGKTEFYFSKPEERGYIDSLDFKVNGKQVSWQYDKINIDICRLSLNEPLKPHDTAFITTPFFVKIPDAKFSRLGHTGQAYYITQWYPKPAVFDNTGWHAMPYLDLGEFYSEFGSFDVSITLPGNYLLAATGDRVDAAAEEEFLNSKVTATVKMLELTKLDDYGNSFPPSSPEYKTVRFKQSRVHDFAWFADKRFYVLRSQVEMPVSKRTVDTWVFFTPQNAMRWKEAISYVNESTLFYSRMLGDYPYNHVTAVDGTIMAGGGMEYPNITVIGNLDDPYDLDVTIAHEVGHNWFYGILGSNERRYAFLDEGINSFYEMRYTRNKYPEKKLTQYIGKDSTFRFLGLNKMPAWKEKEAGFMFSQSLRNDQPLNLTSADFSKINYGTVIYCKTPVILDYMMEYLGEENFDKAMKAYYEQYKFRHPSPEDFFKTLSSATGKDLSAFEKHLFNSTDRIDYKIKRVKRLKTGGYELKLKNKTGVALPFNVYGFKDGKPVNVQWHEGFERTMKIKIDVADADKFKIDGLDKMPDINRSNNLIKAQGLFKKIKPLQLGFVGRFNDPAKTQLNYIPLVAGNFYNGPMAGVVLHNYGFYRRRFEYLVAPMFAFSTRNPVGQAELCYNIFPIKILQQLTLGFKAKTYAYDRFDTKLINEIYGTDFTSLTFNYLKLTPYVEMELKKKNANSPAKQTLMLEANYLATDSLAIIDGHAFDPAGRAPSAKTNTVLINRFEYNLSNRRVIDPFLLRFTAQQSGSMTKVFADLNYHITVSKNHYVSVRLFAGAFVSGTTNERAYFAFRPSGYSGSQDYLFDGGYAARNEKNGFGPAQFMERDGNMKVWTILTGTPGWMTSLNIKSPRLFILPLKVYADALVCDPNVIGGEKMLWDLGLNITLLRGFSDIYIPLVYSAYIKDKLRLNNQSFVSSIRFTFNIHKLVPKNLIQDNFLN